MKVSIGGVEYTVRKIKVGEMLPLLPRFDTEQAEVQREMVASCTSKGDEKLTLEQVDDMDWDVYNELSKAVLKANGFGDEVGK